MSSASEKQAAKLVPLLRRGEPLLAGVPLDGLSGEDGQNGALESYLRGHGLDPRQNIAYSEFVYGYLGVTDSRLLLAKSPFWGTFQDGADALVEAFGERARHLEAPDPSWL